MDKIRLLVDELVKWDQLAKAAKAGAEKVKAQIQELAVRDLENSKDKTVKYYGTGGNVVTVTNSATVKIASLFFLRAVLGDVTNDFVKEEVSYKLSEPFKRTLAALCTGNYIEQTLDEVIAQMSVDETTAKLLRKKLRGNPDKDRQLLESLGIKDVDHWVYFVAEAAAYERIRRLMDVAGYIPGTSEYEKALHDLKLAVIVDEGIKIGLEYEEE